MNQNQFVWHDRYKIGVDFLDKEHKQLFSTMNKLLQLSDNEEKVNGYAGKVSNT